jgi:hypothetical protein
MTLDRRALLRRWSLAAGLAVALGGAQPAHAQLDANTRAVLAYGLTLQRLEACAAALQDVATWMKQHPQEASAMRSQPWSDTTLQGSAARLEKVPAIKAVLDKHALSGLDFALGPLALTTSYTVVMAARQGVVMPADRVNATAVATIQAHLVRVEQLMPTVYANLRTLRGEPP